MSVKRLDPSCQGPHQLLVQTLEAFEAEAKRSSTPLSLQLTPLQLTLLAAHWTLEAVPKAVVLVGTHQESERWRAQVQAWEAFFGTAHHWHILSHELGPEEQAGQVSTTLSQAYHYLLQNQTASHYYIIPQSAHEISAPDPGAYHKLAVPLHVGERAALHDLVRTLTDRGYVRFTDSLEPGALRVRGEAVDVYHPTLAGPLTITLYGNVIESIVATRGRRSTSVRTTTLYPIIFPPVTVPLASLLKQAALFRPQHLRTWEGTLTVIYDTVRSDHAFPWREVSATSLEDWRQAFVFYQNLDRVKHYMADHRTRPTTFCRTPLAAFPVVLAHDTSLIISEASVLPEVRTEQPLRYEEGLALLAELQEGKPAVHSDHGIGIYEGLQRRTIGATDREYLIMRYAEGDMLSVPVEFAYKVTAYLGEGSPTIHRLGGTLWAKTRKQARRDAEALAKELLATARARVRDNAESYVVDPSLEQELERSFPYSLTPDQESAWQAVQRDLQQAQPMDRLIVGDVGFGKTEIAIRAARHVMANGKQVAILAPTTLLVQQHADTFKERLADYRQAIGTLSRFSTPGEAKVTRQKIAAGKLNIVIGTHALLSAATKWHSLGLVIIDEEQRFGVTHKEHFKKIRAAVDVLSLSATPIPRTLSMALSGLKQLSIISTPPAGRKSVQTHVGQEADATLAEALARELKRGGQAYVIAPKIRTLPSLARRLSKLLPEAKIMYAHGQMASRELASIMQKFDTGELDILVSSTIVENGLDLPNVNTLIVMQATHFGLGELYQLRGRVGRRERQGYAYFLYNQYDLTSVQRQRLAALIETARLGSGWTLAQRDLEIRGAGNLLGAEQSGTVNAVGVQLYLDMVQDAVHAADHVARRDVEITLPIPALLPPHYIDSVEQRTHYYQLLSRARNVAALESELKKLAQAYGPPPAEVEQLALLLRLQHAAAAQGIERITSTAITPPDEEPYARLQITGRDLPHILRVVHPLGNWAVRGETLTLDVDAITPALVSQLTTLLITNKTTDET